MKPPRDITGETFNHLTAISAVPNKRNHLGQKLWLFSCSCGVIVEKAYWQVVGLRLKSCGHANNRRYFGAQAVFNEVYSTQYAHDGITFEQFYKLSQGLCFWCHQWAPSLRTGRNGITVEYHGLDRLDNSLGHTLSNVVSSCWSCNDMRSDHTVEEFMNKIKAIYNNKERI